MSLAKTPEKSRLTLKKKNNKQPIPDSGAALALSMLFLASLHPSSGPQVEHPGKETARKVQTPESQAPEDSRISCKRQKRIVTSRFRKAWGNHSISTDKEKNREERRK